MSSSQKRPYWFNSATGQSVWECPPDLAAVAVAAPVAVAVAGGAAAADEDVFRHASKRARDAEKGTSGFVVTSYQPPVSGSAEDAAILKTAALPPPVITPDLPAAPGGASMWERQDIMVNIYLAQVYKEGCIKDANGVKQKFKDITNPIQGRHLYNLIKDNRFTRTLEVGLAMGM
jgi:hypothetical protein